MLETTLKSPLDSKETKPVSPKENQPWIIIGRIDAEAEAPILWLPNVKSLLIRKDLDAGKDWRQEEKGTTKDAMVGWHHWFDGHEFEQAPGDGEGQGNLACYSAWGFKELDLTEQLNDEGSHFRCVWLYVIMDHSPPGSSVHRILQARILEWVACPPSGDLPILGIKPASHVSCIDRHVLHH